MCARPRIDVRFDMKTMEEKAKELARLMEDGKGKDVALIDVSDLNSWTDYFVIVTVTSSAHKEGLYKQACDYAKENELELYRTRRKQSDGDDWQLTDFGDIVVHLMSSEARGFYDLEKLWHSGRRVEFND